MILNLAILIALLVLLVFSISKWKIHPFVALVLTALALGISTGLGGKQTVEVLLKGFSETLRWIAIIIILGAFIGEVMQETGSAFRIAGGIVKLTGTRKLPWAMGMTGYLVSIPVFVDVAYILLQPVTESLSVKSKKPVLYIGLSLAAGLAVSHTLIPPTPGPLAVASLLEVDMGRMILINIIVALCAMAGGILWVIFFCRGSWTGYDKKLLDQSSGRQDQPAMPERTRKSGFLFDLLPILAPILLIAVGSFIDFGTNGPGGILGFVTTPLVAVLAGAFIAVLQLNANGRTRLNTMVEQAILKSALVIMITGAGGSLGYIIRETGMQDQVAGFFGTYPGLGFLLPFLVASILTISTGSITVSLVGTASMLGPVIHTLPVSPEMTAALIGCGSFCVFHANSSFFWLLNRLHEVPPKLLYRTYTLQSLVMGVSGLAGVLLLRLVGFR